jgi:AcrR family transcriptional regulator
MTLLGTAPKPARARPLSGDDRRSMIVDAVIPLLLEFGGDVTTRQIAESAGIAEGTLFRAFGDKESIIQAAVDKFLDPEPLRAMLRSIEPELPLRERVREILFHLQARTSGIIQIMSAVGGGRPSIRGGGGDLAELVAEVLEGESELRVDPATIAYFLRLVAFASSIEHFNEPHPFSLDELTDLILNGITRPGTIEPDVMERDH